MKRTKSILSISMLLLANLLLVCNVDAAKKPKGIVIPEGDNATVVTEGNYTTISFPDVLSAEDMQRYDTDFLGYMLSINAKISSSGSDYNGSPIYYYVHNSKEWLHKGQYEDPSIIPVSKIKSIKFSKYVLRLRDFNKQMPLLDGSKEKQNDSGYQQEVLSGEDRYIFLEISLRD